ncbi:MAG: hypothetical protein E7583_11640, partial [Ruminococcaceae bacterium]|nr:hypothetical protein [Oscillospiraceae bacterium]
IETLVPTCTEPGTKVCTCTVCGTTEEFGIKALGHNFVNGICTRCGIYYIDIIGPSAGASRYSLYFVFDELRSAYGESPVDEYGAYLHHNDGAKFDKVAVYLIQDGTMWRRCIAAKGSNITSAIFVPYLANDAQIKYSGLNSPMINNFPLSKGGDGIWKYSNYATIGANLEDSNGNLILDLADIGIAGKETRVFDDLNEMIKWLNGGCYPHDWDEGKVIKEPTEFNAGFMLYTCKNCGATKQVAIAPKHTHTWDAGKVIKPATETETGIMRYTCTAEGCGATNDVVIPIIKPIDPPDPNRELIDQGKCGENLVWYLYEDGELEIAGYGEMYDYGFSEAPWYMYASMINKLTIGNKVTTIGNAAFWSCDAIKTVHIGDSLGYIGSLAFNGATAIEKYYVSENNATYSVDNFSKTKGEEYGALMSKDKTELVLYPAGCTKLIYHAPESVEKVSEWAFAQSKLRAVNLPGIKAVGMQAFFRCTALTSVVLGKDLEFLGTYSFYGCSALKAISIPSKTTSIGDSTFAYCTSLDQVIIPTSVSTIDANAFNNSANVTIWCYTGSTAHKYAVAYSIPYVIMNGMIRIKAAAVNNLAIVFENVNNEFVGAVKGIEEGVLCSEVLNDLLSPAESQKLIVTDESGNEIENTEIGVKTGYKVKAVDDANNVVQEVLLVVEGDVNGDGVVNLADVNAASKEIRVLKEAEEANAQLAEEEAAKTYLIAADLDNDGSVSNEDMKSFLAIAGGFAVAK